MTKIILYILIFPLVIWSLDSININGIFKKNKEYQGRVFYIILAFCISYLLVSFLSDFVGVMNY